MKPITIPHISIPIIGIPVISILTIGFPGAGAPLLLTNEEPILLTSKNK